MNAAPTTHAQIKNSPAPELTDELLSAAKTGDPVAVDGIVRATFPMIERMAYGAASRQFPADHDRRTDLADELVSCGMEFAWRLLSHEEDTADGYGKLLRRTAAHEMQARLRDALYGDDDPDGNKRFGEAIKAASAADTSGSLEYEDLVTIAADLVTKLDKGRRLSKDRAESLRRKFMGTLSLDADNGSDGDEPAALTDLVVSTLGNPEEDLFGLGYGKPAQEQTTAAVMAQARSARVRYLLDEMENRSPVRAVALKATYGIDGHPAYSDTEALAAYMRDLSPEFADVDARALSRRHLPRGRKTLENQWLAGKGADASIESLAIELGLEDA